MFTVVLRKQSALLLHVSRARVNDTKLLRSDTSTQWRRTWAGCDAPPLRIDDLAEVQIDFPELRIRQELNAQDPLAKNHNFLIMALSVVHTCTIRTAR